MTATLPLGKVVDRSIEELESEWADAPSVPPPVPFDGEMRTFHAKLYLWHLRLHPGKRYGFFRADNWSRHVDAERLLRVEAYLLERLVRRHGRIAASPAKVMHFLDVGKERRVTLSRNIMVLEGCDWMPERHVLPIPGETYVLDVHVPEDYTRA